MPDLLAAYTFAMPSSSGDSPAYGSEAAEFLYSTGTLTEYAPTGCPTYSPPTPSRCTAASVTALPTAQRPPSEFLYRIGTSGPVEQLPVEAQLPSILRFLQDLVIHQHNQLRAQELLSGLLGNQAEQLRHSLSVCASQLSSALNALAQAQLAHARLKEDFDSLVSDFLAFKIRAEAALRHLSATIEPFPAQLNRTKRMAALPYNAHLATLRTFQVPADQWSEANPLARTRREVFSLEDRVNRLERNLPP